MSKSSTNNNSTCSLDFRKDIVDIYQATAIEEHNDIQLTGAGMLLIALVRGGDYSTVRIFSY